MNNVSILTLLLAKNQAIITKDENSLEKPMYRLSKIAVNLILRTLAQNYYLSKGKMQQ
jgi:hypothetical protein